MNKIRIAVLLIAIMIIVVWGIYGLPNNLLTKSKIIKVGVSYITSMSAIDDVKRGIIIGFKKTGYESGKNIIFDFQNAQGEQNINTSIAQKFANSDYDLFISITTPSSQALANFIKKKPIIFSAVSDPKSAGLLKSENKPGRNITGVKDIALYKKSLELIKKIVPAANKIGIIYNPGESNSQFAINETRKIADKMGLEIITAPANNTNEIISAASSIADKVDVFLMTSDNTILSGQESLIKVSLDNKKPMIAYEQTGVEKGALAAVGTNYEKLGELTAEMAVKVIKGGNAGNMAVIGVEESNLFINTSTAMKIGIDIPKELLNQAKRVYK